MVFDANEGMNTESKCNLFSQEFSSAFGMKDIAVPDFDYVWNETINCCTFTALHVHRKLEALKQTWGLGLISYHWNSLNIVVHLAM